MSVQHIDIDLNRGGSGFNNSGMNGDGAVAAMGWMESGFIAGVIAGGSMGAVVSAKVNIITNTSQSITVEGVVGF